MALVDQIIGVESGGNPNAANPNSSAAGPGQFIDSTWLAMLAKHRPDIQGTPQQLLALKTDPALARDMTAAYAADNAGILSAAGLPVTPGTQYLAHFAGPKGAVGLLSADPTTPVGSVLGEKVVAANPFLNGKTAGDLLSWADRKMGTTPTPSAPATGTPPLSLAGATSTISKPSDASDKSSDSTTSPALSLASLMKVEQQDQTQPPPLLLPIRPRPRLQSAPAQSRGFSLRA